MNKEEEKKELNIDKILSTETFNAIINVISLRQEVFEKELESRNSTKLKTDELIDKLKEAGAGIKEIENIIYFQQKIFESADREFYKNYEKELIHQDEIVEFLNTFTNKKWKKLPFVFNEECKK